MTETTTEKKTTARKTATPKHLGINQALAAFQADLPTAPKNSSNPHFKSKFTSLDKLTEVVFPKLQEQGLAYTTLSRVGEDGKMVIEARLIHAESGEYLSAEFPVAQVDPQKIGSSLSYFRRYGLATLTGVVSDEDDDGNAASAPEPRNLSNARQQAQKKAPAKNEGADEFEGLRTKIREWIGSDEDRRKQAVAANEKLKLEHSGVDLQRAIIKELGV